MNNVTPIVRPARTVIVMDDGRAEIFPQGNMRMTPHDGFRAIYLGVYDLAELLRIACDSDAKVLEVLAQVMREGHRFRSDFERDRYDYDEGEPF